MFTDIALVGDFTCFRDGKNYAIFSLLIFAHLGTGIGLHMTSLVSRSSIIENPKGVILESPFNNIKDEITNHPFSVVSPFPTPLSLV